MVDTDNASVKRSPSPIHHTTCENKPKHSLAKEKMEHIAQPTEKVKTTLLNEERGFSENKITAL